MLRVRRPPGHRPGRRHRHPRGLGPRLRAGAVERPGRRGDPRGRGGHRRGRGRAHPGSLRHPEGLVAHPQVERVGGRGCAAPVGVAAARRRPRGRGTRGRGCSPGAGGLCIQAWKTAIGEPSSAADAAADVLADEVGADPGRGSRALRHAGCRRCCPPGRRGRSSRCSTMSIECPVAERRSCGVVAQLAEAVVLADTVDQAEHRGAQFAEARPAAAPCVASVARRDPVSAASAPAQSTAIPRTTRVASNARRHCEPPESALCSHAHKRTGAPYGSWATNCRRGRQVPDQQSAIQFVCDSVQTQ